jgi:RHS repeat-associated protein
MGGYKHAKTNVVKYNEYYPFGLQTANSWTRENSTGNNFLYNGGTELNTTTQVYDLHYRNYDPVLGRMNQVDPVASKYGSVTPYNYAFNSPVVMNDPFGDDPKDPKNTPKPTGAGGNANGGCSWCSPQDTGNGMGGFGNGSQLFSRSNAFFNPGWQPGSGSLSKFGGPTGAQAAAAREIQKDKAFLLKALNTPTAQVSFVMGQNGVNQGYNALVGVTGQILYLTKDNSVTQSTIGGWVSVGSSTVFDFLDNTSFTINTNLPQTSISLDKYDGHAFGISVDWVLGGGFNFSIGYVMDRKGNGSFFYSGGPSVGFSMGISGFGSDIKATPGKTFDVSKYEGYGSAWEGTIFGSYLKGGDTEQKWHNNYGFTYIEEKGGYGWGIPVGLTYQFSKTVLIK